VRSWLRAVAAAVSAAGVLSLRRSTRRCSVQCPLGAGLRREDHDRWKMPLKLLEIVQIRRVDDTAASECGGRHDHGVRERCTFDGTERLASSATQPRWHVFDDDGGEYLLTDVTSRAPPLDVDDGRHDRQETAAYDIAECFRRSLLAPLERDEHSSIKGECHAARRRFFLGALTPCHSASILSIASALSGGTRYFSK